MERTNGSAQNQSVKQNKKPFSTSSKNDPSREFTSQQGYYRDEEDTLSDRNDTQLHEAIMSALMAEGRLNQAQVFAAVENGVVRRTGTIPEINMKLFAEEVIEKIPGIRRIENNLTLDVPPDENRIGAFSSSEKTM